MAVYLYTALKNNRTVVSGRVEASDINEARKKVRGMDLIPTSIVDIDAKKNKKSLGKLQKLVR